MKIVIASNITGISVEAIVATAENPGISIWVDKIIFYESNDLVEYGFCEDTLSPRIDGTPIAPTNATWARSAVQKYAGTYSWLFTKTSIAGGGIAAQRLQDNTDTTDMHGFIAGKTYRFGSALRTDCAVPGNAAIILGQYYAGAWNYIAISASTLVSTWEYFEKTVTINNSTTGLQLYVYIASAENVGKLLYVDNLNITPESRLTIDLYSAKAPQYAALIGHNLSSSAVVKVEANTTSTWTTPAISETMTVADLILYMMTNTTAYRYWSFVFDDYDTNEDGYIEIGYATLGDYTQITPSSEVPFKITNVRNDVKRRTDTNTIYGTPGISVRRFEYNFPSTDIVMIKLWRAIFEANGLYKPFIFSNFDTDYTDIEAAFVTLESDFTEEQQGGNKATYSLVLQETR
jgi:hypothetical protein